MLRRFISSIPQSSSIDNKVLSENTHFQNVGLNAMARAETTSR